MVEGKIQLRLSSAILTLYTLFVSIFTTFKFVLHVNRQRRNIKSDPVK